MRVYTVHLHGAVLDSDRDLVLVKEGFSWPAFFFSVLWAFAHRLWLAAVLVFALQVAVDVAVEHLGLSPAVSVVFSFAIAAGLGFIGNDLRRNKLARRGFRDAGVVAARGQDAALRRYLDANPSLSFGMGA